MKQQSDNEVVQNSQTEQKLQANENQQLEGSNIINRNHCEQQLQQNIQDAEYKIMEIPNSYQKILTASISNNLKYFVFGGFSKKLEIWDFQNIQLIKNINIRSIIYFCKFTEDSKILYVRDYNQLYKFQVNRQFKNAQVLNTQVDFAYNISCIMNNFVLITSMKTLAKTYQQKQLFRINAHDDLIMGLDYNKKLNIAASSDKSIKLWNLNDLSLIMQKKNEKSGNQVIMKLQFIINNNQLISSDLRIQIKVWNVNYQYRQLELIFSIKENIRNLSLDFDQQFIKIVCHQLIKIFTIKGEFIRQMHIELNNSILLYRLIQPDSMRAIIIYGDEKLFVCKIEID